MFGGIFGLFPILFGLLFSGLALLGTIFWIWMLIDCATRESNESNEKIIWILLILFTHVIGAAIYFFVRRHPRVSSTGR